MVEFTQYLSVNHAPKDIFVYLTNLIIPPMNLIAIYTFYFISRIGLNKSKHSCNESHYSSS